MKNVNTGVRALSTISSFMTTTHDVVKTQMRIWCETAAKRGMDYFLGSNCCASQSITPVSISEKTSTIPTLETNLFNFLQKQTFYLLFWGATHGSHTIIKHIIPDPLAYTFPMFAGAITQGYYNCPTQKSIETQFPNVSMFTGAINGWACCFITSTILNSYLGAVVGGLAFMLCNSQFMCGVEGIALALSKRTTESGLSLTTFKNLGADLKGSAIGAFVERLVKETSFLQHGR